MSCLRVMIYLQVIIFLRVMSGTQAVIGIRQSKHIRHPDMVYLYWGIYGEKF